MKYRDYVRLTNPVCVGIEFVAGVCGCPINYGLKNSEDCASKGRDDKETCIKCWDQEIPGRVIATAKKGGCAIGLTDRRFFRDQKYEVLGISNFGNPKIKAEGWESELNCDRNFFYLQNRARRGKSRGHGGRSRVPGRLDGRGAYQRRKTGGLRK